MQLTNRKRRHEIAAHDAHLKSAVYGSHCSKKLIDIAYALTIDHGDDVAGPQAVTCCGAACFYAHHEYAFDARRLRFAAIDVGNPEACKLRHDLRIDGCC